MHDIVEFLRRRPPFDDLDDDALDELARAVEVEFHTAESTIFRKGEGPIGHVRVVRRGAVELVNDGRVLDVLGEGELFGHPSMLSGLPTGFEARAREDSLCYRLPAEAVVPLLARPAGLRFVTRTMLDRPRPDAVARAASVDSAAQPVARLVSERPVICRPTWTVREAAQQMAAAKASAALVRLDDFELGIVTDRDLRDRVVAGGLAADAPVTEVMSAPALTITPERSGAEAMLEMLDHDLHHLPVVWPHGEVLGVLTEADLLAAEAHAPFSLRRSIEAATAVGELRRTAAELRPELIALHESDVHPLRIGSIMAVVVDAVSRRLVELTIDELGPPPCPFTLVALGSLGRRELVPSSDVDSALVWDGAGDHDRRYMSELGARVVAELAEIGFAADAHGATAAGTLFDRSFDDWRSLIRSTISDPDEEKVPIFLSLLADARPIFGVGNARDPLSELRRLPHRRPLMRLLLRLALVHRPPTGLRRLRASARDLVERPSERDGRLDVKAAGLLPIVDIARYGTIAAGVRVTSTRTRLDAAATAGVIDGHDARSLGEAFELFSRLRFEHQVGQLAADAEPDDLIDVRALNPVTRGYVREAFHAVAAVQRSLRGELNLPP